MENFMTTPKGDGVMVMPDPMVNGEYAQDQVIEDWWHQGLSYDLPDLGTLENFHPFRTQTTKIINHKRHVPLI